MLNYKTQFEEWTVKRVPESTSQLIPNQEKTGANGEPKKQQI